MKFKLLLLCGATLLAAGCNSTRNPYDYYGEFGFNYDLVPQPLPGLSPSELTKIEQAPIISPPPAAFRAISAEHNDIR
jgi:hypothetical protein